jgi:hypothetical protein
MFVSNGEVCLETIKKERVKQTIACDENIPIKIPVLWQCQRFLTEAKPSRVKTDL